MRKISDNGKEVTSSQWIPLQCGARLLDLCTVCTIACVCVIIGVHNYVLIINFISPLGGNSSDI